MLKIRNRQIYEEAAEWLVDLRVGDMDGSAHEQLDAWFRESPLHIRAFLELSAIWEKTEGAELDRGTSTESLIARVRAGQANVVALTDEGTATGRRDGGRGAPTARRATPAPRARVGLAGFGIPPLRRILSRRSAVLAAALLVCLGFGIALAVRWSSDYSTGTGEQRIVQLADGSTIQLNSRSRLRVAFSRRERSVELIEGQALFQVAKDRARPFVVRSAGTRVRAVGTQFDVYRKASGTQVSVVEGRVAVLDSTPEASAVLVAAGEQVVVTGQRGYRPHPADVRAVTAWTRRELVFDTASLVEVAQEFNRYNTRQLVVSDGTLEDFHVTGVFSSTDPASLLRFLRAQPGIDVREADQEIRIGMQ